jgi:hypothetical protein
MKGFTLFEIIIYIAISSLVFTSLTTFAWTMVETQTNLNHYVEDVLEELYVKRM